MNLIPSNVRDKKKCYHCGTVQSVKYFSIVENPYFVEPLKVCSCNKCAMMQIATKMKTEVIK